MGQRQSSSISSESIQILKKHADEQMEQELAFKNLQFLHKRAQELAEKRELFGWELMAAFTMTGVLLFAGSIYKRKDLVIPIVPLVMGIGYRYDAAFGSQSATIRDSAEGLLKKDPSLFQPIGGPITLAQVDAFIQKQWIIKN